jgi:hypothetical protein
MLERITQKFDPGPVRILVGPKFNLSDTIKISCGLEGILSTSGLPAAVAAAVAAAAAVVAAAAAAVPVACLWRAWSCTAPPQTWSPDSSIRCSSRRSRGRCGIRCSSNDEIR